MSQPTNPRWTRRPEGSTWGDWGPDDQLGRLNLLTSDAVLKAAKEIKTGQRFCLSLPLDYPGGNVLNPRRFPPKLEPTIDAASGTPRYNYPLKMDNPAHIDVGCDDRVTMTLQYSSQWDSFAHMGQLFDADEDGIPEIRYYNGYKGGEDVIGPVIYNDDGSRTPEERPMGARKLGIDTFAEHGVVGRGNLVNLFDVVGRERKVVTYDMLMKAMDDQDAHPEAGDLMFFYTGFADVILEAGKNPTHEQMHQSCAALDGRDDKLLQWITDSGVTAMIADNYAVEQSPARPAPGKTYANSPLHQHCLFKLGVPLGEIWFLTELAQFLKVNKRSKFFAVCPPIRLPGAVGSPANGVAVV
jgi:kynurenine formamidase